MRRINLKRWQFFYDRIRKHQACSFCPLCRFYEMCRTEYLAEEKEV